MRAAKRRTTFTAKAVCAALDIPHGTLNSWAFHGLFKGLDAAKTKPGKARRFTLADLFRLAILKLLLDFGISGERASQWSILCVHYMDLAEVAEMNISIYQNGESVVYLVGDLEMDSPPLGQLMRLTLYPIEIVNALKGKLGIT
jgi:hypothetical protein